MASSFTCETRDQGGSSGEADSPTSGGEEDDGGEEDEEYQEEDADGLFCDESQSESDSDGSDDFVVPAGRRGAVRGPAARGAARPRHSRPSRRRDDESDDDDGDCAAGGGHEDGASGSLGSFIVDDGSGDSDGDDEYDAAEASDSDDDADSVASSGHSSQLARGGASGPATPPRAAGTVSAVATVRKPLTAAGKRAAVSKGFSEFNAAVFGGALPEDMTVSWNSRLRTTAGLTYTSKRVVGGQVVRSARIELAAKVLTDAHRVRSTLLHEMCHAAAWLVDGVNKPPHGPVFKRWAAKASRAYSHYAVQTCHAYEIEYKHTWQCTECGSEFGRHSKSIDPEKQLCGACRGTLVYKPRRPDGTPAKPRKASAFSSFVGERYRDVKKQLGARAKHADVMRALSAEWKAAKASGDV